MKHISRKILRVLVIVVAAAILLWPSSVMAMVWTGIDFVVALVAILATIAVAVWMPTLKWFSAIVAALLIAVPPYPYWLFSSNSGGWYFHFFHGFNVQTLPIGTFALYFLVALLLFASIFWAVRTFKPVRVG